MYTKGSGPFLWSAKQGERAIGRNCAAARKSATSGEKSLGLRKPDVEAGSAKHQDAQREPCKTVTMRRLVESWVEAEKRYHGNTLAAAIRRMNEKRGMRLTHSRVSEWRRGVYVPGQIVLSQMLLRTLPWALKQAGIEVSQAQLGELERLLWVTKEKDGLTYFELL